VGAHLDLAKAAFDAAGTDLDLRNLVASAVHFGIGLDELNEAAKAVGADLQAVLLREIGWANANPQGLAAQLGLPDEQPELDIVDGALVYTLTAPEREFAKALGNGLPQYRDALTSIALEAKKNHTVTSESFKITPQMRQEVYERLRAHKVDVSSAVFQGAGTLIDEQLSFEVARYVFGKTAEFRRRAAGDQQMQTAIGLLRKASTPKDLLSLARVGVTPAATAQN